VKVGERGQIVIPKAARDLFGIKPGDSLLMLGDEEQGLALIRGEALLQFAASFFGQTTPEDEE